MSRETIEWLNENTMVGFTADREHYRDKGWVVFDDRIGENRAWWALDGYEHGYPGAIPPEEVVKVLFNWTPVESEIMHKVRVNSQGETLTLEMDEHDAMDADGPFIWVPDQRFKGILHPRTNYVFGTFGIESYKVHNYEQWLLKNVANILDAELGIESAGLLRNGGVAYVNVTLPEEVVTDAGMGIRSRLLAVTSVDGTKATQYRMTDHVAICDNSLDMALAMGAEGFKVKHTSRSLTRLQDAKEALGIIYEHSEVMVKFLDSLADVDVTDAQFKQIVDQIKPIPAPERGIKKGKNVITNQRAITIAENTQEDLTRMWKSDPRAKQWHGTLLGAFQATNTWHNHERTSNDNGVEKVMTSTINGDVAKFDAAFFDIVAGLDIDMPQVLATAIGRK